MAVLSPSANLADVRYEIRGALTRHAREMEAAGHDIIKLNIGNPGHDSEAYGHEQGLEIAREVIAERHRARGARDVAIERIFIGNGVSELIDISLRALLQPGDEVLLPSPDYPLWSAATILNGGRTRYYRCTAENAHLPDPLEIEALITPRTRALVLINPNNPTGVVYPRALLERLVAIAARQHLLLLSDEIYDEILYDGAVFQPLAGVAGDVPCLSCAASVPQCHGAMGHSCCTARRAHDQRADRTRRTSARGAPHYSGSHRRQQLSQRGHTRRCAVCVPSDMCRAYPGV